MGMAKIISIEGERGSGKSTKANSIKLDLENVGYEVKILSRANYETDVDIICGDGILLDTKDRKEYDFIILDGIPERYIDALKKANVEYKTVKTYLEDIVLNKISSSVHICDKRTILKHYRER